MSDTPVAAFDFDGTLTRRDTLLPFLAKLTGWPRALSVMASQARHLGQRNQPEFRDGVKERMLRRLLVGRSALELQTQGLLYASQMPKRYRDDTLARVKWHAAHDHHLVLVSASLQTYAEPAARALGFDEVIAVQLEADDTGALTGEMTGPNVRGPEKAVRLRAYLADRIGDDVELWAYGNSEGDSHLLAMADHPTLVGRQPITAAPTS